MNSLKMYKIAITHHFKKQLKYLIKKDRLLKESLKNALSVFDKKISISIGHSIYKIRLKGTNKGKSGGYRIYVFIIEINKILAPLCIFPKSEKEDITFKELIYHLESVKDELESWL